MNLSQLAYSVAKYAPQLGAAIGGPAGAVIGAGIAYAFGGSLDNTDDLINRITLDPQAQVKLAEIEANTKLSLKYFDVELYRASVLDKDSARRRETEIAKTGKKDYLPHLIAISIIVGFFALMYSFVYMALNHVDVDKEVRDVVVMFLSILGTKIATIIDYFFGSSIPGNQFQIQ